MPIDASVRNVTPTLTFSHQSRLLFPPTVQCGSHTLFYFMWCGGGMTTNCSWCSAELLSWPSIWIPITLAANARKIAFYKDKFLHWSLINAKVKVWGPKRNEIKSDQLFFQHYPKVVDMIFLLIQWPFFKAFVFMPISPTKAKHFEGKIWNLVFGSLIWLNKLGMNRWTTKK